MRGAVVHFAAGLACAVALPVLALGFDVPFLIAIGIVAVAYLGAIIAFRPKTLAERLKAGGLGAGNAALAEELIVAAEDAIERLQAAAGDLKDKAARQVARHLADVGRGVIEELAREPDKVAAVRRYLTHYLPKTAEVVEGLVVAESQRNPDPERLRRIGETLAKLDRASTYYADNLAQAELQALDIELRLLDRALAEDIGEKDRR